MHMPCDVNVLLTIHQLNNNLGTNNCDIKKHIFVSSLVSKLDVWAAIYDVDTDWQNFSG
jgi:hypothetical protein